MLKITDINFTDVMSIYGLSAKYYHARLCSCVGENNGVPLASDDCEMGFRYADSEDIQVIRTNTQRSVANTPAGLIYDASIVITVPKYYGTTYQKAWEVLGHGDIFLFPNKIQVMTDILKKGSRDKIFAFDVKEVLSVSVRNTIFTRGVDYTLDDRTIVWSDEAQIDNGQPYSVEFKCSQQYRVFQQEPFDRGAEGDDLPRKVNAVIRRYISDDINPIDGYNFKEF